VKRREDWFEGQLDLDPERPVFIDETWASTNMAPSKRLTRNTAALSTNRNNGCESAAPLARWSRADMGISIELRARLGTKSVGRSSE
jgi:hypothetical protein